MTETVEIVVTGKVQGVGFRQFANHRVQLLGINGWVKNMVDGTVCILAQGNKIQLNTYVGFLKSGPSMARVKDVYISKSFEHPQVHGFRIMPV